MAISIFIPILVMNQASPYFLSCKWLVVNIGQPTKMTQDPAGVFCIRNIALTFKGDTLLSLGLLKSLLGRGGQG